MAENQWIVARIKPNQENIAIRNIKNQNFECYVPRIKEQKFKRGKKVSVEQWLFPGYLFVKIDASGHWTSLKYTYGVHSVLMASQNSPAIVLEAILEDLRAREDRLGFVQLPQPRGLLKGDTVLIKAGPFRGQKGLVQRMVRKERERVLLHLLSNQVRVLIDESDLSVMGIEA